MGGSKRKGPFLPLLASMLALGSHLTGSAGAEDVGLPAAVSRCEPAVFLEFHGYREGGSPELTRVCRPSQLRVAPDSVGGDPYTLTGLRWHKWGSNTTYTDATASFCPNMSPCERRPSRLTVTGLEIRHGRKYLYRTAYLKVRGFSREELWVG
jgi:hypothetical protein